MTTNRAHILLWTDQPKTYLDAIQAAGLAERVAVDTLPRNPSGKILKKDLREPFWAGRERRIN